MTKAFIKKSIRKLEDDLIFDPMMTDTEKMESIHLIGILKYELRQKEKQLND